MGTGTCLAAAWYPGSSLTAFSPVPGGTVSTYDAHVESYNPRKRPSMKGYIGVRSSSVSLTERL